MPLGDTMPPSSSAGTNILRNSYQSFNQNRNSLQDVSLSRQSSAASDNYPLVCLENPSDFETTTNVQSSHPCLVVSQYLNPQISPLETSVVEVDPVSHCVQSRFLTSSPSVASLYPSSRTNHLSPFPTNGVVRSASAYECPNHQLPVPPRSPGLSPVTRISFSTDVGSSVESSVNVGDGSFPNSNVDIRLDFNSNLGEYGNEPLYREMDDLVDSMNSVSIGSGPPLYSPPPTYEQLVDPNALPTYQEATKYSAIHKPFMRVSFESQFSPPLSSDGIFTLPPTPFQFRMPNTAFNFSQDFINSTTFIEGGRSQLARLDMETAREDGEEDSRSMIGGDGTALIAQDVVQPETECLTILDAIPCAPQGETGLPVPIRFSSRCSIPRYASRCFETDICGRSLQWPSVRIPCLTSVCSKSLVRQELNKRWPFVLSAQEDNKCPGLMLIKCTSNLKIARLSDSRTSSEFPLDILHSARLSNDAGRSPNNTLIILTPRNNPFTSLSTNITGSLSSGIIAGGLAGSLAGLGVLDTSELNNHVIFYLCGRCVGFDSFDADAVKCHLDLECPKLKNKWTSTSECYLVIRAVILVSLPFVVLTLFYILVTSTNYF